MMTTLFIVIILKVILVKLFYSKIVVCFMVKRLCTNLLDVRGSVKCGQTQKTLRALLTVRTADPHHRVFGFFNLLLFIRIILLAAYRVMRRVALRQRGTLE